MTQSNTGGWQTTVATYARGGRMEEVAEDGTRHVHRQQPGHEGGPRVPQGPPLGGRQSMGSNFLLDWGTSNQAFAAGQVGMYTQGCRRLHRARPGEPDRPRHLRPDHDPADRRPERGRARGRRHRRGQRQVLARGAGGRGPLDRLLLHAEAARRGRRGRSTRRRWRPTASRSGTPQMPIFDQATLEQSQEWIADYVNVPLDQMTGFTDGHLRAAPRRPSRASTPRRCTRSWTPSCRRCSPTRTRTSTRS